MRIKAETFAKPPDVDAVQGVAAQRAKTYHIDRQASEQRTTQKCAADGGFAKVSGYDSRENRQHLAACGLKDGIMQKAHRGCPLSQEQKIRNGRLAKVRYVVEQSFGTLQRKFRYGRAA